MKQNEKDQKLLDNARELLEHSVDAIDEETSSRLRQIRYQALNTRSKNLNWFTPYSAFAATAAVLLLTVSVWLTQAPTINDELVLEDMPLLTTTEELDFYQDLEFYNWLDDEQING
ncbi:MAG: hypothetical protein OQK76_09995 [Gammaproteobacteria bacterium]|nr:hypothetical protein [Gammaproteobacteria bacterium]MCW8910933.1 hypothetical protein [Gammaproteobacteria bacterium]MCW9005151.1 hypothetical protein [Gammaproteobacteria bacterium]MCW9057039.1 hypothetical protein [Gammaproteobacteria bacterium]